MEQTMHGGGGLPTVAERERFLRERTVFVELGSLLDCTYTVRTAVNRGQPAHCKQRASTNPPAKINQTTTYGNRRSERRQLLRYLYERGRKIAKQVTRNGETLVEMDHFGCHNT